MNLRRWFLQIIYFYLLSSILFYDLHLLQLGEFYEKIMFSYNASRTFSKTYFIKATPLSTTNAGMSLFSFALAAHVRMMAFRTTAVKLGENSANMHR